MSAFILILTLTAGGNYSHINWAKSHSVKSKAIIASSNIAIGCLRSGIGLAINNGNFFEGCLKGSISGAIVFTGKYVATYQEHKGMGAIGKLTNDLGQSMMDNVMRGDSWLSSYSTDIGPIIFTWRRGSWAPKLAYTITPMSMLVYSLVRNHTFDLDRSLNNLVPVFSTKNTKSITSREWVGYSAGQMIVYDRRMSKRSIDEIMSHEMIHALQWSSFRACGAISWGNWNIGQDLCHGAFSSFGLSEKTYPYSPMEIEAYTMEKYAE